MRNPPSRQLEVKELGVLTALTALYFGTRLAALTRLPIFSDEAIYIHWAQILLSDPEEWLIPLTDGKPPLFMWLTAVTLAMFDDPLVAGRMVSVLAGWASLLGVYLIGRDLFRPRAGAVAALLYILLPYALFFDRMAVVDSLLTAFGVWSVRWAFHIALETRGQAGAFRMLGLMWGLGLWTKASALLLVPVPFFIFLFWQVPRRPDFWKHLGMALIIPVLMNAFIYYLGPAVRMPGRIPFLHHPAYFIPLDELLQLPFLVWLRNLLVAREFFMAYLTLPVAGVLLAGLVGLIVRRDNRELALWCWLFFPSLVIVLVAQGFFSRYFLPMIPAVALIAAATLERFIGWIPVLLEKWLGSKKEMDRRHEWAALALILTGLGLGAAAWDAKWIRDPLTADLHPLDRLLYVEGMNSGYGIREAAEFLRKQAEKNVRERGYELYLMVPKLPGNPAEGITVYLHGDPNVVIVPAFWWPDKPLLPDSNHFTLRPSIYELLPRVRRHAHLLDFAFFVYPNTTYPQEVFMKTNPSFKKVWSHPKPQAGQEVVLYQNFTRKRELELPTLGKR